MKLVDLVMRPTKVMKRYSPLREGLTEGQENELLWMFNRVREGEHRARVRDERTYASADPVVRAVYSMDTNTFPSSLDMLVKRTAGAVVLPTSRGELLELLRFGERNNVPVVPRGGGTGTHGACVPVEGGVVADMRSFDEVLEIDAETSTVRVQAGITWQDLAEALADEGLALPFEPLNAPYSTVGGTIAMGAGGFGSLANGSIRDNLSQATMLTPAFETETFTGADLDLVVGCQGTTGFILEATLTVREAADTTPCGAAFDDIPQAQAFLEALPRQGVDSAHLLSPEHAALKQEGLGVMRKLPKKKVVVVLNLPNASVLEALESLADDHDGDWIGPEDAQWEWENRFRQRPFKRFGPSLIVAEAVCGTGRLAEAWQRAQDAIQAPESTLFAVAIGPDEVLLVAHILADERMPGYSLATGNLHAFIAAVKKAGGRAAAPGILTPGEAKDVLGKDTVKRLSKWKKEYDPGELMNPGKVLPARVKGLPILSTTTAMGPGNAIMRSMRGQFGHRRESTHEPSNRALKAVMGTRLSKRLGRIADDVYKCSRLGHTNRTGGLHRGVRFEKEAPRKILRAERFDTQLPRGIVGAARALLEGAQPTEQLASHALSLPAIPAYEHASMNGTPILEAIEAVREASQRATRLDPDVKALTETLAETGNVLGEDPETRGDWLPGGAPSGSDTTTLLLAGDIASYARTDDAAAAFNVLMNAGFGFTTLGDKEVHPGTLPYRLGAFDQAAQTTQALAAAAEDRMERLPTTLVTLSSEDADVLRRRTGELMASAEDPAHQAWTPKVVSFAEVVAELVASGRLSFVGLSDDQNETEAERSDDASASDETEEGEDEQADADEPSDAADASDEPTVTDSAGDDGDTAEAEGSETESDPDREALSVTVVHSPFATEAEREALAQVVAAMPGVETIAVAPADTVVPDIAYQLTQPDEASGVVSTCTEFDGPVLVACTDLAHVLAENKVEVHTLATLVAQHMEVREGGAVTVEVQEEEEEGFKEFDIPEGAHRIELVKQEAAIPVFPDESILDAAEAHGFEDLPYDCRAGSCVTCSARFEGTPPDQSEGQSLSEEEQKTHVLTCIAKPKGDVKIWTGEQP